VRVAIEDGTRARLANCPSCGGPLRFRGATSVVAVCRYCHATVVREGARLEDIGTQAELLPDDTLLQVGTTGSHRGEFFTLVGRIQYRYGAGLWNEWHALFWQGRSAWLSDANRDYTITYLVPPAAVPPFAQLKPGDEVVLAGERYTVTNVEAAQVVAGEGELPFRFGAGWEAPVADLRGEGARFATIDYSGEPPHIYVGERLPFDTFDFKALRDPDRPMEAGTRARAFKCAGCGAPITRRAAKSEVVACEACGSVTDVTGTAGEIVQKNERHAARVTPTIPLGAIGRWRGVDYEVVGYLRRRIVVEGTAYEWAEYLLHNLAQGYLWLSEYQGHFSVIKAAAEMPKLAKPGQGGRRPWAKYLGREFRHFQRSEPEVSYLAGEFNWRVQLGEKCLVDDYVAPPLILSSEKSGREITWSLGEYVEPDVLWKAFGLAGSPPPREGVAPNQPSPHKGRTMAYWVVCGAILLLAGLMQFGFVLFDGSARATSVPFSAQAGAPTRMVSAPLDLASRLDGPVIVWTQTNAKAAWVDLDMQLVEVSTGRAWRLNRQLGYRGAADWGGGPEDVAEIASLPSGRYTLAIDARAGAANRNPATGGAQAQVTGTVRVYRQPPGWSNLALLAVFLLPWPLVAWARAAAFETRRWSESDYAPSDDDD